MVAHKIIVIGASAGGFEALRKLVRGLPKDLEASILIVWHIPPFVIGILPQILNQENTLYASNAVDGELIEKGRIYVAPADHHLLIESNHIRVTKGPRENRFRPSVDPLFRSAAFAYGTRVIGIILTGALDDGTAGLWTIKHRGGTAIVQDPADAEVPSMPESALREVEIDYCVPLSELSDLLIRLVNELPAAATVASDQGMEESKQTAIEIGIAAEENAFERGIMNLGELTPYTCPDCHGTLIKLKDGKRSRFRCHTGHAFSADTLLAAVTENIESSLWNVIRGIEESVMLLNHLGEHFSDVDQPNLAAIYFKKAHEAEDRAHLVRQAVIKHEQLSKEKMREQTDNGRGRY